MDGMAEELLGMFDEVPNEDLRAADVPTVDASWPEIFEFGLTFDAYRALGGNGPCGDLANRTEQAFVQTGAVPRQLDLTQLRSCLFFEQRRWHHFGETPHEEARKYFGALLDAIREYAAS
jgi:hypothetical protein